MYKKSHLTCANDLFGQCGGHNRGESGACSQLEGLLAPDEVGLCQDEVREEEGPAPHLEADQAHLCAAVMLWGK